jgi:hypothetical protein
MENIFEKLITKQYFDVFSNLKNDLLFYLFDKLKIENNNILRWDLRNALTNNANEEYI